MAGDPAWWIGEYDEVRRLLADPRLGRGHDQPEQAARYSSSLIIGTPVGGVEEEQQANKRMRKRLARAFSARRLALLDDWVHQQVDQLLDDLARQDPPADFHEAISFPLPALVISELLGVPPEDRERFRRWSDDAGDLYDQERSLAGLTALWEYMQALIERKRTARTDDVLSELVTASEEDPEGFSADGIAELAAGLLFAGHETTVTAIDHGMLLFLTHPEQRAALARDPELVPTAVEEILRHGLTALATDRVEGVPRYAGADIEVDGVVIPAGDLVLLDIQAANRTERFLEPAGFDITRTDNPHLTFGHGPRFCLGAPLARIELRALFATVFQRFPGMALAVPPEALRPRATALTGGLAELPVTW
jgi:cytochrome P450